MNVKLKHYYFRNIEVAIHDINSQKYNTNWQNVIRYELNIIQNTTYVRPRLRHCKSRMISWHEDVEMALLVILVYFLKL